MVYKFKNGNFKIEVVSIDRDYVYYKNYGCSGVEMMHIDYLRDYYVLENW